MVGQMGHCCKKDFKSHKFSVINVFNKHADIIFSSCHYDDDEEEKPPFFPPCIQISWKEYNILTVK